MGAATSNGGGGPSGAEGCPRPKLEQFNLLRPPSSDKTATEYGSARHYSRQRHYNRQVTESGGARHYFSPVNNGSAATKYGACSSSALV